MIMFRFFLKDFFEVLFLSVIFIYVISLQGDAKAALVPQQSPVYPCRREDQQDEVPVPAPARRKRADPTRHLYLCSVTAGRDSP